MHLAPTLTTLQPAPRSARRGPARDTGIKLVAALMLVFSLSLAVGFWQYQQSMPQRLQEVAVANQSRAVFESAQADLQLAEKLLYTLGLATALQAADDTQAFMRLAKGLAPGFSGLQPMALAQVTGPGGDAPPTLFRTGDTLDLSDAQWGPMSTTLAQLARNAAQKANDSGRLTMLEPVSVGKTRVLAIALASHQGSAYVALIDMDKWLQTATRSHAEALSATLWIAGSGEAKQQGSAEPGSKVIRFDFENLSPRAQLLVSARPVEHAAAPSVMAAGSIALFGVLIAGLILLLGTRGNEAVASATLAGQALTESDERLQRALQLTRDGVWEYDLQQRSLHVSEQVLALIGWEQGHEQHDRPTPSALLRMLPRHWRREVLRTIAATAGKPATRELKFPVGDAMLSSHWMRLRVRGTSNAAGKPWLITGSLADISEEVTHENAQERYRALLMRILDAMPIPVAVKTADQQVVMLNERYASELLGTIESMMARADNGFADRMEELDQVAIATGEPQIACEWLKASDGNEIYLRITRALCDGLNGEPIVLGTYEDLTELQRQAQQQTALREYFEKVFDHLPSPTYIKDADHRYILTNQAHARVNRTTKEDMIGKRSADYSPDEADEIEAAERHLLSTASDEIHEKEYVLNSGNMQRNTIIRKVRITDPAGNPVLLGTSSNVTTLREAEGDLRQQAEQQSRLRKFLQDVFDAVPHPLFVKDRQHRYIMTNRAHAESVGADMDAIIGKRSTDFVSEDVAQIIEHAEEALFISASIAPIEHEYVLVHHTGQTRHNIIRKALCSDAQGAPVLVGVTTDITALREAEADLRQQGAEVPAPTNTQDSTNGSEG